MGKYIGQQAVIIRVEGKVRFTTDVVAEPNKMSFQLLNRLILEAEGQVELDLSPRYDIPFSYDSGDDVAQPFDLLPSSSQDYVRTLCELMSVIRIMETDFGRAGPSDGAKYTENTQGRYNKMVKQLTQRREDDQRWVFPPLLGLRLNYFNQLGDTGYTGQVLKSETTHNHGSFPQTQINNPAENFFSSWNDNGEEL